jgi:histidinol phosphatase-like enzyme
MEAQGIVIAILPQTTYGKENKKKGGFVIEFQDGKYQSNLAFECFDKALMDMSDLEVGDNVSVNFSVKSREWQGKWYTNVNAFGVKITHKTQNSGGKKEEPFRVPDNSEIGNLPFALFALVSLGSVSQMFLNLPI